MGNSQGGGSGGHSHSRAGTAVGSGSGSSSGANARGYPMQNSQSMQSGGGQTGYAYGQPQGGYQSGAPQYGGQYNQGQPQGGRGYGGPGGAGGASAMPQGGYNRGSASGSYGQNYPGLNQRGMMSNPQMVSPEARKAALVRKIKEKFINCCTNGNLKFDKFNEALRVLETQGLRRLRDTPLGLRLFRIFDVSGDQHLSEDEFIQGMINLIESEEKRIEFTFRAYDVDGDGTISKDELLSILEQSWIAAFRILADELQQRKVPFEKPSRAAIDHWTKGQLPTFLENVSQDFDRFDVQRKGYLDQSSFRKWLTTDRTIRASITGVTVQVAVSFYDIQDKAQYPSMGQLF